MATASPSFTQLQKQIAELQRQADELRRAEIVEVVAKIKVAVAEFGLTEKDIFGRTRTPHTPNRWKATPESKATAEQVIAKAKKPVQTFAKTKDRTNRPMKYTNGNGLAWSGVGKRPYWFKEAIEAGKTADDMLVIG